MWLEVCVVMWLGVCVVMYFEEEGGLLCILRRCGLGSGMECCEEREEHIFTIEVRVEAASEECEAVRP